MKRHDNWDSNNRQIRWDDFDGESYQEHYFRGRLEPEDGWAMLALASTLRSKVKPGQIKKSADIGTGSSLVLPLAMAPYVEHIDLIEPGRQNVGYLTSALTSRRKMEEDWGPTIQHLQAFDSTIYRNVIDDLIQRAEVHHRFAQDVLEEETYDGLTMGFCAGSNSDKPDETAKFMDIVLASVKPGSIYAATHTLNSEPYPDWSTKQGDVDMAKFPSLKVGYDWYADRYRATGIELHMSPMTEMRPGYDGTLLALGFMATQQLSVA
jgi:hypothetical protein